MKSTAQSSEGERSTKRSQVFWSLELSKQVLLLPMQRWWKQQSLLWRTLGERRSYGSGFCLLIRPSTVWSSALSSLTYGTNQYTFYHFCQGKNKGKVSSLMSIIMILIVLSPSFRRQRSPLSRTICIYSRTFGCPIKCSLLIFCREKYEMNLPC